MDQHSNISGDLIWEVARNQNAFLVKSKSAGGFQFSRDPLNLTNKHSRTHAGFINDKAVGVVPGEKGGVTMVTKKSKNANKPASHYNTTTFNPSTSNQKIYKAIANQTAKHGYRADLRAAAVSRASAIKNSQRPKKDTPAPKKRGAKAQQVEE